MDQIRLRNNETGEEITKSIVNWKHLDKASKEKYTVLDGETEAATTKKITRFTPPELEQLPDEAGKPSEQQNAGNGEGGNESDGKPDGKEGDDENAQKEGEEQTAYILRLAAKGFKDTEIAKIAGIHFQKVKSIIKNAGNGEDGK